MVDTILKVLSGLLPFLIAIAGSLMSYRHLSDKHHTRMTVALIALGIFGSAVTIAYQYRADKAHEAEVQATRAEERRNYATLLSQTQKNFDATVSGLEKVITNSDRQFTATMKRTTVMLDNVTGGESYSVVLPFVIPNRARSQFPLVMENHGKDILTGVTCRVTDTGLWMTPQDEASILRSISNRQMVGTLHPGERIVINAQVSPDQFPLFEENGESFHRAFIDITAQNFTVAEDLDFKKDAHGNWLFRYRVVKTLPWDYRTPRRIQNYEKHRPIPQTLEVADWTDNNTVLKILPVKK